MKGNFTNLMELASEVERQEKTKNDYLIFTKEMWMQDDTELYLSGASGGSNYELTDYAHGQLATKLGIPKTYYDKMSIIPELRTYNVNKWFDQMGQRQIVRTLDGKARAILSDRFKPIDNYFILSAFLPALKEHHNLEITASALSDIRMYLQVTFPSIEAEIVPGDVVRAGVILTNSEVGAGAVDIKSVIWRLACKNGMISNSILRRYHVGRRVGNDDSDYDVFKDDTIQAELKSYQLRMRDVLSHALTQASFEEQVALMKKASYDKIESPTETIQNVTKRFNLTSYEGESILKNMVQEMNLTRYGLANGVTALSHITKSFEQQYEYEKLGAEIINITPTEWSKLSA